MDLAVSAALPSGHTEKKEHEVVAFKRPLPMQDHWHNPLQV